MVVLRVPVTGLDCIALSFPSEAYNIMLFYRVGNYIYVTNAITLWHI